MPNSEFFFSIFIYLLLGHLLADFVCQPEKLMLWKHKSWKGILVHSLIVLVMTMLCLYPLLAGSWWVVTVLIGNALLHFLMDGYKIGKEEKCEVCRGGEKGRHNCYVRWFLLDQFFHIAVLLLATFAICMGPLTGVVSIGYLVLAIYLIVMILVTYVWEIVKFQFSRQKRGEMVMKFNYSLMIFRFFILNFALPPLWVLITIFWMRDWRLAVAFYVFGAFLVTYVWEVVKFQILPQKNGGTVMKLQFKRMLWRFLLWTFFVLMSPVVMTALVFFLFTITNGNMP